MSNNQISSIAVNQDYNELVSICFRSSGLSLVKVPCLIQKNKSHYIISLIKNGIKKENNDSKNHEIITINDNLNLEKINKFIGSNYITSFNLYPVIKFDNVDIKNFNTKSYNTNSSKTNNKKYSTSNWNKQKGRSFLINLHKRSLSVDFIHLDVDAYINSFEVFDNNLKLSFNDFDNSFVNLNNMFKYSFAEKFIIEYSNNRNYDFLNDLFLLNNCFSKKNRNLKVFNKVINIKNIKSKTRSNTYINKLCNNLVCNNIQDSITKTGACIIELQNMSYLVHTGPDAYPIINKHTLDGRAIDSIAIDSNAIDNTAIDNKSFDLLKIQRIFDNSLTPKDNNLLGFNNSFNEGSYKDSSYKDSSSFEFENCLCYANNDLEDELDNELDDEDFKYKSSKEMIEEKLEDDYFINDIIPNDSFFYENQDFNGNFNEDNKNFIFDDKSQNNDNYYAESACFTQNDEIKNNTFILPNVYSENLAYENVAYAEDYFSDFYEDEYTDSNNSFYIDNTRIYYLNNLKKNNEKLDVNELISNNEEIESAHVPDVINDYCLDEDSFNDDGFNNDFFSNELLNNIFEENGFSLPNGFNNADPFMNLKNDFIEINENEITVDENRINKNSFNNVMEYILPITGERAESSRLFISLSNNENLENIIAAILNLSAKNFLHFSFSSPEIHKFINLKNKLNEFKIEEEVDLSPVFLEKFENPLKYVKLINDFIVDDYSTYKSEVIISKLFDSYYINFANKELANNEIDNKDLCNKELLNDDLSIISEINELEIDAEDSIGANSKGLSYNESLEVDDKKFKDKNFTDKKLKNKKSKNKKLADKKAITLNDNLCVDDRNSIYNDFDIDDTEEFNSIFESIQKNIENDDELFNDYTVGFSEDASEPLNDNLENSNEVSEDIYNFLEKHRNFIKKLTRMFSFLNGGEFDDIFNDLFIIISENRKEFLNKVGAKSLLQVCSSKIREFIRFVCYRLRNRAHKTKFIEFSKHNGCSGVNAVAEYEKSSNNKQYVSHVPVVFNDNDAEHFGKFFNIEDHYNEATNGYIQQSKYKEQESKHKEESLHTIFNVLLNILPFKARVAVTLYSGLNGKTYEQSEIAELINTSRTNVCKKISKAYEKIRNFLKSNNISVDDFKTCTASFESKIKKVVSKYFGYRKEKYLIDKFKKNNEEIEYSLLDEDIPTNLNLLQNNDIFKIFKDINLNALSFDNGIFE